MTGSFAAGNIKQFLSASSNYHHVIGQFSHGEKHDSKLKVAFDIFAASRMLFILK